jgi:acetyltransferase-like isoleucine patch superfamily enzyme
MVEEPVELRAGLYDVDEIGAYTFLGGEGSVIRHVAEIGRFSMIGPGAQIGLVEHPGHHISAHVIFEHDVTKQFPTKEARDFFGRNRRLIESARASWAERSGGRIRIGNDVWIGQGVTISRGVTIGDGAIVASRAVVTKDVEPYSIVGGVPGKHIKWRFPEEIRRKLLELQWWRHGLAAMDGVDVTDVSGALARIERNIGSAAHLSSATKIILDEAAIRAQRGTNSGGAKTSQRNPLHTLMSMPRAIASQLLIRRV